MPFAHIVKPGSKVDLSKIDPNEKGGIDKGAGKVRTDVLGARMEELQELLFASGKNSLLIILQGRDTSGKDGTIKKLLSYVNVQSTRVASFKVPTERELSHDFLWRIHAQVPGKGEIAIFNRSHYEDVLVVRVHDLAPEAVWKARFDQINQFESLLAASGTIIVKFYLHIDKAEQEERLLAREEDLNKAWKLSAADWKEREFWGAYETAFEDALSKCSTKDLPWNIIPANHKWFRDLAITEAIVAALEPYEEGWRNSLQALGKSRLKEIEDLRKK